MLHAIDIFAVQCIVNSVIAGLIGPVLRQFCGDIGIRIFAILITQTTVSAVLKEPFSLIGVIAIFYSGYVADEYAIRYSIYIADIFPLLASIILSACMLIAFAIQLRAKKEQEA